MTSRRSLIFVLASTLAGFALAPAQETPRPRVRRANATKAYRTPGGEATLWLDPAKWKPAESEAEDTLLFVHRSGRAQARLVFRSQPGSFDGLKQERIERIRAMDANARITYQKRLEVNGFQVLSLRMNFSPDPRTPFSVWSYLYGDEERSVELFALIEAGTLARLTTDINEMLDGLDLAYSAEPVAP